MWLCDTTILLFMNETVLFNTWRKEVVIGEVSLHSLLRPVRTKCAFFCYKDINIIHIKIHTLNFMFKCTHLEEVVGQSGECFWLTQLSAVIQWSCPHRTNRLVIQVALGHLADYVPQTVQGSFHLPNPKKTMDRGTGGRFVVCLNSSFYPLVTE